MFWISRRKDDSDTSSLEIQEQNKFSKIILFSNSAEVWFG